VRVLVLGASGYVGGVIYTGLAARHEMVGTSGSRAVPGLRPADLREEAALAELAAGGYDLIVHSAGVADLGVAEADPGLATALNVRSTQVIVDAIAGSATKLLFLSSDNVFAGTADSYTEDDERSPINAYGRSKAAAEDVTLAAGRHLVIRLPLMFGRSPYADRFLDRLAGPRTPAQTDVVCAPLYLPSLPGLIEALADRTGVLHVAGPDVVTRFELMTGIQRALRLPTEVVPVREADSAQPDLRPRRLVLRSVRHELHGAPLDQALPDYARAEGRVTG
jgi:dTDP-4-dehydrorhamnose reductase